MLLQKMFPLFWKNVHNLDIFFGNFNKYGDELTVDINNQRIDKNT